MGRRMTFTVLADMRSWSLQGEGVDIEILVRNVRCIVDIEVLVRE